MNVALNIVGTAVTTVIQQSYKNTSDKPIEISYSCGLGKRMAVCAFKAVVAGETIIGKIKEAKAARDKYDDKISQGHTPMLGERTQTAFNISLGNLQPNVEISIEISILSALEESEDGSGKLVFGIPEQIFPASTVLCPVGVSVNVSFPGGLQSVAVTWDGVTKEDKFTTDEANNETASKGYHFESKLEKDKCERGILAVEFVPRAPFTPAVVLEEDPAGTLSYAAQLTFLPQWSNIEREALSPCLEAVFLVDRSGSMGEAREGMTAKRIATAKETLQLFLSSLPPSCKFNLISFGSRCSMLFPSSQKYSAQTLKQAQQHVNSMSADFGGTNLLEPLDCVFYEAESPEFPRVIFILTDGAVDNTEEVLKYAREHVGNTRIFAIGIGKEADEKLVKGLAQTGRGLWDMVSDGASGNASLEPIVIRQLARAMEPTLRKVKVEWNGCQNVRQFPTTLPAVVTGDRLVVYGRDFKVADAKQVNVVVTGIAPDESPYSFAVPTQHTVGTTIHKLAAWNEILTLQEALTADEEAVKKAKPKTKAQTDAQKRVDEKNKAILELGLKYGLATKQTSWYAVKKNEEFAQAEMVSVSIPSMLDEEEKKPIAVADLPKPAPVNSNNNNDVVVTKPVVEPPKPTVYHEYEVAHHYHGPVVYASSSSSAVSGSASPAAPPPAAGSAAAGGFARRASSHDKAEERQQVQQQYAPAAYEARESADDEAEDSSSSSASSFRSESKRKKQSSSHKEKLSSAYASSSPSSNAALSAPAHVSRPPTYQEAPRSYVSSTTYISTWEPLQEKKAEVYVPNKGNPQAIVPIAKLQNFDGSFSMVSVESFFPECKNLAHPAAGSGMDDKSDLAILMWATALAVAFLQKRYPDDEPTWRLLVQKAKVWLRKTQVSNRMMGIDFIGAAEKAI